MQKKNLAALRLKGGTKGFRLTSKLARFFGGFVATGG
jgi:hypothetical protein